MNSQRKETLVIVMCDTTRKTVGLGRKRSFFSGDNVDCKSIVESLLYQIVNYKLRMKLKGKLYRSKVTT